MLRGAAAAACLPQRRTRLMRSLVSLLDEAWRFFRNPTVKEYVVEGMKTWRKRNAAMLRRRHHAIGRDHDTIKPGLAMILDPFGETIAESQALDDDVAVATLTEEKLKLASGQRYIRALAGDQLVDPGPHPARRRPVQARQAGQRRLPAAAVTSVAYPRASVAGAGHVFRPGGC